MPEAARGFTLLETVIALAVLMVTLLLGLALIAEEPRIVERLEARAAAWDAIETTLEALRAGDLPLVSSSFPAGERFAIEVEVEETPVPGLSRVTVRAHYQVRERPFSVAVETGAWQR